jgi:hypothetical protein
MPRLFVSKCGALIAAGFATVAFAAKTVQPNQPIDASTFESTFSAKGEPATLYYKLRFAAGGSMHTMQIWRDGDKRLRRRTDDVLDTYVIRETNDPTEYQMIVVDYAKRITTRIDRNNLVRLGHFSDWFDLAHGLRHPVGQYRIVSSEAPPKIDPPIGACRWHEIQQGDARNRVCWSERERLPLVIWSSTRGVVWRVTDVSRDSLPADTFDVHDKGFVRNDANTDIEND